MKKFLNAICWLWVAMLCLGSFTFAYTQEEISAYNWAYKNWITTQPNIDAANLNWKLTRQELSKMLTNYIENVAWIRQTSYSSCSFTDEDKMTTNLKPYTRKICAYWIMWANWQNFRPTSKVNRAELWTTISRMLWWNRYEVGGKDFYIYHLNALKDQWIMNNIDNPAKSLARRWDTFIMLKRLADKFGDNIYMNDNKSTNNGVSSNSGAIANNTNKANEISLTQDEVKALIEEKEWLTKGSLSSAWYECNWKSCTYHFNYSNGWKKYIYSRNDKKSGEIEKIQDLWVDAAEEIALKDAKVSKNDAKIMQWFSSNGYIITIKAKENVFDYTITLDGKIKEKKVLITEKKALEIILKEVNIQNAQNDIEKENKDICYLTFDNTYKCSFAYWWKQYISYINAEDWKFIPIKKTASGWIEYWKSISGTENVIVSQKFTYIDSDKAMELLSEKYNIEEWWFHMIRKEWEGNNAIYIYTVNDSEYYIDALNWTTMNSKDQIISVIAKDSGVSKNIIKNSKENDDSDLVSDGILETSYVREKTKDVCILFSFDYQWITYTYKVRTIDWKILDSNKGTSISEDKAVKIAKQTIQKKYSPELQDDYELFNWNTAYLRYVSDAATDEMVKMPSEPEYVVILTDEAEENIYRVILKHNGDVLSESKISFEELESNFLMFGLYFMGYDLDDLKDQDLSFWISF